MIPSSQEIEARIKVHLSDAFESLLQDNLEQMPEIGDVVSWVQQSHKQTSQKDTFEEIERDKALSAVANEVVKQVMKYVPEYMGELIVENIQIKTKGKEKSAKFDLSFTPDSFYPYVEIVKKINGNDSIKIKIEFQIDSDIHLNENNIKIGKKKVLGLGHMIVHMVMYMTSPLLNMSNKKISRELEFETDLSEIRIEL